MHEYKVDFLVGGRIVTSITVWAKSEEQAVQKASQNFKPEVKKVGHNG